MNVLKSKSCKLYFFYKGDFIRVILFLFWSHFTLGQVHDVSCFTVIDDSTKNYSELCFNDESDSVIQQFYKMQGAIPMENALKFVKRKKEINSVTYKKLEGADVHVWSIVCNYKMTIPKKAGGFVARIKYREIRVDSITGELLSKRKINMLHAY